MNMFDGLKDQLPDRNRLLFALAIGVIGAALLGNMLLVAVGIIPKWQLLETTNARLVSAQEELQRTHQGDERQTPEGVQAEIDTVRQQIAERSAVFLSEAQAAQALDHLYQYAGESGSTIIDVQGTPVAEAAAGNPVFEVRSFYVTARGSTDQLLSFVGKIEETAQPSFLAIDVEISPDESAARLDMDITLRVSPYADAMSAQATTEETLQTALVQAWDIGQWTRVIDLLGQLLESDPGDLVLLMQLYTAHMNHGNELLEIGDLAEAKAQFEAALVLKPNNTQAAVGLQQALQQAALDPASPLGLTERLDAAWAEADWPQVIEILGELRAGNPESTRWSEKLYSAHVNYGYLLASKGEYEAAKTSYSQALRIRPNGGEAIAGLQALTELPGPAPVQEP